MPKNIWQKIAKDVDSRKSTQQKKMKENVFFKSLMKKNVFLEQDV
jgi:hypothetical protein